jgi:3',5'-cyclic AMP phosphodiesterase CpdA
MTAAPILVAQISDLHIKRPGALAYGKVDTAAALTRCIAALNRFTPRLELVVVTGDLVDTPTEEEYAHLKRLLAPLEIPIAVVPGNHDARAFLRSAFPNQPYAQAAGALNLSLSVGPLDIVLIDSSVPDAEHGILDADTIRWLDATLATSTTRPALLFVHHPPFVTGIQHMDQQNLRNARDLAPLLKRHSRVRLIGAGHVHRATLTTFAGVAATICPAPNHAVALDLCERHPPSLVVEPPAFHVHAWLADESHGGVVTHLVPIGDFDGPHPFFDSSGRRL